MIEVSGIMMRLKVVKQEEDYSDTESDEDSSTLGHGVKVLKELISPWTVSGRFVCTDSYFAYVQAAETMYREGLKFIGVIKNATRKYSMKHFQAIELQKRGDRVGLVRRKNEGEGECDLLAFAWMDSCLLYTSPSPRDSR